LISEYTRPARCKTQGKLVSLDQFDKTPPLDWPEIGTMEIFASDGLRSLLDLDIPNMIEMTARHKGHLDAMRFIKDAGFLDEKHIDTTIQVLSEKWQMKSGEEDLLRMNILIKPFKESTILYSIYDEYTNRVTAMARTTAYSCIAIAQAFYKTGNESPPSYGVVSPEEFIMDANTSADTYRNIIKYLTDKGIKIEKRP
jgi:saccharopine dehydrogenase-like NADP-dependent oxidoreductase